MRSRSALVSLVSVLLMVSFTFAPQMGKAAEPEKKPVEPGSNFVALMRTVLDAWETLDPANVAPFYSQESGRLFFDIAPLKYTGWNEYAEGVKKAFAEFSSVKFTPGDDVQVQQRGNFAWGAVTVRTDVVLKDGTKQSFDARWTIVWQKRGKDWIIAHDHFSAPAPLPQATAGQSLYKRLGGYDAIAAVTDDFIGRLVADQQLGRFFTGASTDSKKRIRQLVVDQLCAATGGPCVYIGRSMKASHEGLGITEDDWNAAVNHLVATLDKFKVPPKEKDELLGLASSLKGEIVATSSGGVQSK
ncbi:MAG TPA: nuclear transport factor 2 family protein [Candidatus Acidoferrales bacterium]